MDLHRQAGVPEWETIPREQWNQWQRRANATNGWDTPGNRESLKGLIATTTGLYLMTRPEKIAKLSGVGLIGYGRYKDIKDGKKADETGTKSPLGESIDAGVDKVLIGLAAITAVSSKTINLGEVAITSAGQTANVALTGIAKIRNREIHPGIGGKVGTFGLWAGLGSHFLADTVSSFGSEQLASNLHKTGTILTYAGVLTSGLGTIVDYVPAALGSNTNQ